MKGCDTNRDGKISKKVRRKYKYKKGKMTEGKRFLFFYVFKELKMILVALSSD
jgi:hypothetical protein